MLVDNDYYKRRDAVTDLQLIPFGKIKKLVHETCCLIHIS